MALVVDTSAVVAVIAREPTRDAILRVTRGEALVAPASLPWEVGNAFAKMFRRGRASLQQSVAAVEELRKIPIRLVDVDLQEALALCEDLGVYAYDAYVLACARRERLPIVTLDRGMRAAAITRGLLLREVT